MPGCPGDCLRPAFLDQPHLVTQVRVVLGVGDQRGGQVYPVTAAEHDPHRRHRPRTPSARGTPTPGAETGDGHIGNLLGADRLDVPDGLPGHEPAPVAADLDAPGGQPGAAANRAAARTSAMHPRVSGRVREPRPSRNSTSSTIQLSHDTDTAEDILFGHLRCARREADLVRTCASAVRPSRPRLSRPLRLAVE